MGEGAELAEEGASDVGEPAEGQVKGSCQKNMERGIGTPPSHPVAEGTADKKLNVAEVFV